MGTKIIALYSDSPRAGKDTVAQHLVKHWDYVHLKFATPLKSMARLFLRYAGIDTFDGENVFEGDKDLKLDILQGLTPRDILITLGTTWGRDCVGENVWTDIMEREVDSGLYGRIVISDMRFENEWTMLETKDSYFTKICGRWRPTTGSSSSSSSGTTATEGRLSGHEPNWNIFNSGTKGNLYNQVDEIAEELG